MPRRRCSRLDHRPKFQVGDLVEFFSAYMGGCWKPGVIADWTSFHYEDLGSPIACRYIRIDVGNGLCVIRDKDRVRLRVSEPVDTEEEFVDQSSLVTAHS